MFVRIFFLKKRSYDRIFKAEHKTCYLSWGKVHVHACLFNDEVLKWNCT